MSGSKKSAANKGSTRMPDSRTFAARKVLYAANKLASKEHNLALQRFMAKRRQPLIWWRWWAWLTIGVRIICLLTIYILILRMRFGDWGHIYTSPQSVISIDLLSFFAIQIPFFMLFVVPFCILVEILLGHAIIEQYPFRVAVCYGIAFSMVCVVLGFGAGATAFHSDVQNVTTHLMGLAIVNSQMSDTSFHTLESEYQCCGMNDSRDWSNLIFYEFHSMVNDYTESATADRAALGSCNDKNKIPCVVPTSCCPQRKCALIDGNSRDVAEFLKKRNNAIVVPKTLLAKFQPQWNKTYRKSCREAMAIASSESLIGIIVMCWILAVMQLVLTILIVVILLYHDSIGKLNLKIRWIRPSDRHPLVKFFIWLDDVPIRDDITLTDWSIVEAAKNLNVDDQFGADFYKKEEEEPEEDF